MLEMWWSEEVQKVWLRNAMRQRELLNVCRTTVPDPAKARGKKRDVLLAVGAMQRLGVLRQNY
jgi:hypothetical protein